METVKVGIREFREKLAGYLECAMSYSWACLTTGRHRRPRTYNFNTRNLSKRQPHPQAARKPA